jgi:ABC-type antimicrobial peptide transport system permease subunit
VQVTAIVVGVTAGGQQSGESVVSQGWGTALDTQYQCAQGTPNGQSAGRPGPGQGAGPGPCQMVAQDPVATNGYDSIVVKVDSTDSVVGVTSQVKALGVYTQTAQDILDQVTKVLTIVGIILGAIGALSLLVATIGIINTMIMATYERRREIGVMRATGASRRTVLTMFTLEAGMIGFWGGMLGLGIALVARLVGNNILNRVLADQGLAGTDVISFPIWLVVGVVVGTTLLGVVAGVLPAGRAARLDPVEALASAG